MDLVWMIYFYMIPLWTFILIPFSSFYYEADDGLVLNPTGPKKSRIFAAVGWTLATAIVVAGIYVATYLLFSDAEIPVQTYSARAIASGDYAGLIHISVPAEGANFSTSLFAPMTTDDMIYANKQVSEGEEFLVLKVPISTFFGALMAWLGWFLFAVFGGIGMSAIPMDLISGWRNRPRRMDAAEYAEAQMSLRERTNELVQIGELIKVERDRKPPESKSRNPFSKENRKERDALNSFKTAVFVLEKDVEDFQAVANNKGNPLTPYLCLFFGILSVVISVVWLIQIIVYVIPSKEPYMEFLNDYFEQFENWFPLFGVLSVAIFTMFTMMAAVKGCFKFGLRCGCIQLHPMVLGKTYMSSMLFNSGLMLLCAIPVVQFCATAFSSYARNSTIYQIFGVQVENLKFFGWWWESNIFVYIFLGFTVLAFLFLLCKPRDGPPSPDKLKERLKSRSG